MATSGIVRRIDELGRIVIPKELRRTMRLNVGDEMEIVSSGEELTLKRYNGFESISQIAKSVAKLLAEDADCDVVFFDTNRVVVADGKNKKQLKDGKISDIFSSRLRKRKGEVLDGDDVGVVFDNLEVDCKCFAYEPILTGGDLVGGVALLLQAEPNDVAIAHLGFCARMIEASLC